MTWTRRIFLKKTLPGWLTLVALPGAYALARRGLGVGGSIDPSEITIGIESEFQPGSGRVVRLGREKVIVGRTAGGSFHAVGAECTHLGCSIRFVEADGRAEFACNCHDSRFDLEGKNLSGPAPRPLTKFRLENDGTRLILSKAADPKR